MSTVIERDAAKPKCGRCYKDVDSAKRVPIVEKGDVIGWKLTYKCHGEEKSLDVLTSWFLEPGNETKPFVERVFEPIVVATPTVAEALRDDFTFKAREKAIAVRNFIGDKVRSIIEQQIDFDGDYDKWLLERSVDLISRAGDFLSDAESEIRVLYVGDRPIGHFVVPVFLDNGEVQWVPTPKTKVV